MNGKLCNAFYTNILFFPQCFLVLYYRQVENVSIKEEIYLQKKN